ncbi:MAG: hypothetical protein QOH69_1332 [Actinomycetota bacterium]|nr:hypothetical protein [Actinomycetota bacterium]
MQKSSCVAAAISTLIVIGLSGCASSVPALGLVSAKQSTIALETSISEYVPHDSVIATHVTTKSAVLYPCLGHPNEFYWPGSLRVEVKSGVDEDAVLGAIADHWSKEKGWIVTWRSPQGHAETVELRSDTGELFTVKFEGGSELQIAAVSACFPNAGLSGKKSY